MPLELVLGQILNVVPVTLLLCESCARRLNWVLLSFFLFIRGPYIRFFVFRWCDLILFNIIMK